MFSNKLILEILSKRVQIQNFNSLDYYLRDAERRIYIVSAKWLLLISVMYLIFKRTNSRTIITSNMYCKVLNAQGFANNL